MQVKKFIGKSLPQALLQAKRELGGEVILLESKEVDGGMNYPGQTMVEITVGLEEKEDSKIIKPWNPPKLDAKIDDNTPAYTSTQDNFQNLVSEILNKKPNQPQPPEPAFRRDPRNKKQPPPPDPSPVQQGRPMQDVADDKEILKELSLLRKEVEQIRRSGMPRENVPEYPKLYAGIFEELLQKGVGYDLSDTFIKRVYRLLGKEKDISEKDIRDSVLTEMNQMVTPYTFHIEQGVKKQRVILLLGSTGVGKSTTAMKLAAHPEVFGKQDVAIISVDPYGPSEALKSFSRMNGTTVHEEKNINDLKETINKFKLKDVIIIDTPGKSPFAPNHLNTLENYVHSVNPTDIFLVLGMTSDMNDLFLSCAMFLLLKPTGVIFTKFDETTQPGKVLPILESIKLPVVSFCDGKRIFIDIELGKVEYLYNKLFDDRQGTVNDR